MCETDPLYTVDVYVYECLTAFLTLSLNVVILVLHLILSDIFWQLKNDIQLLHFLKNYSCSDIGDSIACYWPPMYSFVVSVCLCLCECLSDDTFRK